MPAYSVLELDLPGRDLTPIGILLEDPPSPELHLRLRRDWDEIADEFDALILENLAGDLLKKASESDLGAGGLFRYLEDSASSWLRITDRRAVEAEDPERTVNRLYRQYVRSNVVPFRTHLPLYSLRAAAGKFLENEEITEESWIETPDNLRLGEDMFCARIVGHSMEPHIPDGSVCVFRHGVKGTRQGRLVLAEDRTIGGTNRYAVKRYQSEYARSGEEWRHRTIRLESLNPAYPHWDLHPEEERYAIVGEFVRVIE